MKTKLREKDGITIYRVLDEKHSAPYIIKQFSNPEDLREIENYQLLNSLGIKTLKILEYGADFIAMEDIEANPTLRLATEADLGNIEVSGALGRWYKKFHDAGEAYLKLNDIPMYSETDQITIENLNMVKRKTNSESNPFWNCLQSKLEKVYARIASMGITFSYNDFYYCNLVVDKSNSEAFMFDYNLMGMGSRVSDLSNVICSLKGSAKDAFLEAYGDFSEDDFKFYSLLSPIIGLIFASKREVMPEWAKDDLKSLKDGELLKLVNSLIE
ncbi:MAG: hypothetical protein RRY79_00385 [Clostridia bacterium]